jgi:serine/threonine-protein kinase
METTLAGHYQIVRHLGGGGFGQTFLAKDSHLPGEPLCVVKQLKPKAADNATLEMAKRLFNREAQTLYRLGDHDQLPRLLAHFEQDDEFYLVQEYIEGQPLDRELAERTQLSEASVIPLLQDILEVLVFVHQQNVIHRDIKPANLIRRSKDGKIVLIDFGAVKEVSAQVRNTLWTNELNHCHRLSGLYAQ